MSAFRVALLSSSCPSRIGLRLWQFVSVLVSRDSSTEDEMQDERNNRKHQKNMNQSSSNMEHPEPSNPCNQQNDEQNGPDTHLTLQAVISLNHHNRRATFR